MKLKPQGLDGNHINETFMNRINKSGGENMFEKVGKKIKEWATFFTWIGIGGFIIVAIIMFYIAADSYDEEYTIIGFVFLIAGPLTSWINGMLMYGFGEIVDGISELSGNNCSGEMLAGLTDMRSERTNKIEQLRKNGFITEEEYQQALSKGNIEENE